MMYVDYLEYIPISRSAQNSVSTVLLRSMMKYSIDIYWQLLLFLSMLSSSLCAPLNASSSGLTALIADCYDYEIPVTTQTLAYIFRYPEFSDNFDVVGFIGDVITRTTYDKYMCLMTLMIR
jgi:hypothetical protein